MLFNVAEMLKGHPDLALGIIHTLQIWTMIGDPVGETKLASFSYVKEWILQIIQFDTRI